jgi:hypothetical protein
MTQVLKVSRSVIKRQQVQTGFSDAIGPLSALHQACVIYFSLNLVHWHRYKRVPMTPEVTRINVTKVGGGVG